MAAMEAKPAMGTDRVRHKDGQERSAPADRRRRPAGGRAGERDDSARRGGGLGRRRAVCSFCLDKVKVIDYKDVNTVRRFLDGYGKIKGRRKTGTCAKHQRRLAVAIKRARHLALLPFVANRGPHTN